MAAAGPHGSNSALKEKVCLRLPSRYWGFLVQGCYFLHFPPSQRKPKA